MIPCQRDLFDLPREIAYLNCAYMSPLMKPALEAGERGLRRKARPWTLPPAAFFDEVETARDLFATLMGVDFEGVAIVPAASYGIETAAKNLALGPGKRVVTLADQFPSNVYPWRRRAKETGAEVVAVSLPEGAEATPPVLDAIDERCAVAALPNVLWTTGARLDLERIGERCREVGAALVLDLTQSAGAMACDLGRVRPDFAVAAAYKWLMGPYSVGFLYVAPERREGAPLEESWTGRADSGNFERLTDYTDRYLPGARRFDMGERSNFALLPAAIAALEKLIEWRPAAIGETLGALTERIAGRCADLGLEATPLALRGPHYLSLRLPESAPEHLTTRLAERDVHVSRRGRSLRVTPHLYNDDTDVDRFVEALGACL